jgi:hypothetical protein
MPATQVLFSHPYAGNLIIEDGIDLAQWAYGLNTATFPTYAGEVVQILSVYIDNLTIGGTVSTYTQMELIYQFFSRYLQVSTAGTTLAAATKALGEIDGGAYNLQPVSFTYPQRGWNFSLYPTSLPGFHYGGDIVAPVWSVQCFVEENAPDLSLIKDGLKALAVSGTINDGSGTTATELGSFNMITGNISPQSGNPNTDPFQTYDQAAGDTAAQANTYISTYSSYYNSLIPAYSDSDFKSLTGEYGSSPTFGKTSGNANTTSSAATTTATETASTN